MADAPVPTDDAASSDVQIDTIGPALKRLTITIRPDTIANKLEESLGTLATEATLPGFRKGHIPRRLLERRFGEAVRNEAKNQLMADAYADAIEKHSIQPVGEPEATDGMGELEIHDGKPLTFSLEVEVVPEVEVPNLDGIEIKRPLLEITEKHIAAELDRHLYRMGTPSRIDSGFQPEDRLVGHVVVRLAAVEESLYEQEQSIVVVPGTDGQGVIAGLLVDDLGERLTDTKTGDTITIEMTGPDGHELEAVRGAPIEVTYRIIAAERVEPAPVETMIERFGLGTEGNLREQVKLALEHQCETEQRGAMREQVYTHLLASVEIDLPEKLSAAQAARNLEGHRVELMHRGVSVDEIENRLARIRADTDAQTRNRLKLFFLMRKLGDEFAIDVSEQEVNGRIAEMAAQHNQRPEQLRAELQRSGRLGEVARMVREHKTADRVIEKAKIVDLDAEAWNELVRAGEDNPTAAKKTTSKSPKKKRTKKAPAKGSSGGEKKTVKK